MFKYLNPDMGYNRKFLVKCEASSPTFAAAPHQNHLGHLCPISTNLKKGIIGEK